MGILLGVNWLLLGFLKGVGHVAAFTQLVCKCMLACHGPGWRGVVYILSIVPTIDWVLPGSGGPIKG